MNKTGHKKQGEEEARKQHTARRDQVKNMQRRGERSDVLHKILFLKADKGKGEEKRFWKEGEEL